MYQLIRKWINAQFTTLATITSTDFDEADTSLDITKLPASAKYLNYNMLSRGIKPYDKAENDDWKEADVMIQLIFGIYNKAQGGYQTCIDTYANPLLKYFKGQNPEYSDNTISTTLKIAGCYNAELIDLDKFDGKYLMPKLKMNLLMYDP